MRLTLLATELYRVADSDHLPADHTLRLAADRFDEAARTNFGSASYEVARAAARAALRDYVEQMELI